MLDLAELFTPAKRTSFSLGGRFRPLKGAASRILGRNLRRITSTWSGLTVALTCSKQVSHQLRLGRLLLAPEGGSQQDDQEGS